MRAKVVDNFVKNKPSIEVPWNNSVHTLVNGWNKDFSGGLKKRKIAKILTGKFVIPLMELHSPLEDSYRKTYYCNDELHQDGINVTGRYCGNRWCYICNRIRTAKLINGYGPVIAGWNAPAYMVLTVKNVKAEGLRACIIEMNEEFRKIVDNIRKRDGIYIEAVRTIEVTYNWKTDEYHPHFNLVINGMVIGNEVIRQWLEHFPSDQVHGKGQYIKKADKGTLNELFKYVVKLDNETPARALDVIFQALRGLKITAPTGVKKVSEEVEELIGVEIPALRAYRFAIRIWEWDKELKGWYTLLYSEHRRVELISYIEESPGYSGIAGPEIVAPERLHEVINEFFGSEGGL